MLALGLPQVVVAQGLRVVGRVVHVTGADSIPVVGRTVILHRVSLVEAGPVDSGVTDRSGRYTLRDAARDTTANYVVSVEHDGIAYFSEPLDSASQPNASAAPLFVYDTSSTTPPIILRERHLVIRAPSEDGSRRVIELLVLENRGVTTRVAADTSQPVWEGAIPPVALQFQVGESDMSAEAVSRRDDAVAVTAPIPPGDRQLLVSYVIPSTARALPIPIDQPIERFNVLLEDTAAAVEGPVILQGMEELEQLSFRRYAAQNIGAQTNVTVRFVTTSSTPSELWWIIVPLVVLTLVIGFLAWWRRTGSLPVSASPSTDPDTLAAQIAALDKAFEARSDDPDYRERRAALKRLLVEVLRRARGAG